MKRRIAATLFTAGIVAALGWPTAAFAATPSADVLAPAAAVGGGPVGGGPVGGGPVGGGIVFTGIGTSILQPCATTVLAGLGFQPNEPITVTLGKVTIGKTNAATNGSFSTPVTIPAGTVPGTYTLASVGATGFSSSTDLTVGKQGCHLRPHLSNSTVVPGESTVVSGSGCVPETPVILTIAGKEVGHTTANSEGHFSARITPPGTGVGQVTVTASCGGRAFTSLLDLVTTSKGSSPEGSTAVFAVFVLLGILLLRGLFTSGSTRRRRKRRGASDVLSDS